jgi:hypothetical protein
MSKPLEPTLKQIAALGHRGQDARPEPAHEHPGGAGQLRRVEMSMVQPLGIMTSGVEAQHPDPRGRRGKLAAAELEPVTTRPQWWRPWSEGGIPLQTGVENQKRHQRPLAPCPPKALLCHRGGQPCRPEFPQVRAERVRESIRSVFTLASAITRTLAG